MKLNKKIKAFTLSEMIVVLILTVIVVGLAFSVLTLVQKQMLMVQSNFEKSSEINRLEIALYIDFHKSSTISVVARDNSIKLKSPIDTINYSFNKKMIIREKDTFDIAIQQKWFFFNGEKTSNGLIDALKIETSKDTQSQIVFVFKQNDAFQFMTGK